MACSRKKFNSLKPSHPPFLNFSTQSHKLEGSNRLSPHMFSKRPSKSTRIAIITFWASGRSDHKSSTSVAHGVALLLYMCISEVPTEYLLDLFALENAYRFRGLEVYALKRIKIKLEQSIDIERVYINLRVIYYMML